MDIDIRPMAIDDYDEVLALWRACEGIGLAGADSREGVAAFLEENPGFSLVALDGDRIVGAVLSGHNGRRGTITHLAVDPSRRRLGIGRRLAERCVSNLRAAGIRKCHIMVFSDNRAALAFWHRLRWHGRPELTLLSKYTDDEA